jgi:D-beta-D-heptose 7-phosphate kinase / D-beta-D-heptose 1-phosphate adenosyltransferase
MSRTANLIDKFTSLHVAVLGDAMLDVYLRGHASRLCQEAAVPVIDFDDRVEAPGGAANTAVNVQSLGARTSLISVVGRDREGRRLCESLSRRGVDTRHVLAHPQRRTLTKQRVVAGSQLVARIDQGDTGPLNSPDQFAVSSRMKSLWPKSDGLIISDYDYGTIGPETIVELAELARRQPVVIVGDSKRLQRFAGLQFTAIKPNYGQATQLLHAPALEGAARVDQMYRLGSGIFKTVDSKIIALTLDQDGALVFQPARPPLRTFTEPNLHTQAAGAGDTYVAAFALALAAGGDVAAAAETAAAAAAIVVAKDGTSSCTAQELKARLSGRAHLDAALESLVPTLEERRARGKRIVLTNGCFDLLHRGHITYLNQARALGDLLVVGVNTDESIRRLKGPERPINALDDRMQVLAALSCVDHVVAFDDDTPHRLVKAIRPHVFVKGGDYTRDRLPEAALVEELGGRVEILPLVRERSTTRLISRIRAADEASTAASGVSTVVRPTETISLPYGARLT